MSVFSRFHDDCDIDIRLVLRKGFNSNSKDASYGGSLIRYKSIDYKIELSQECGCARFIVTKNLQKDSYFLHLLVFADNAKYDDCCFRSYDTGFRKESVNEKDGYDSSEFIVYSEWEGEFNAPGYRRYYKHYNVNVPSLAEQFDDFKKEHRSCTHFYIEALRYDFKQEISPYRFIAYDDNAIIDDFIVAEFSRDEKGFLINKDLHIISETRYLNYVFRFDAMVSQEEYDAALDRFLFAKTNTMFKLFYVKSLLNISSLEYREKYAFVNYPLLEEIATVTNAEEYYNEMKKKTPDFDFGEFDKIFYKDENILVDRKQYADNIIRILREKQFADKDSTYLYFDGSSAENHYKFPFQWLIPISSPKEEPSPSNTKKELYQEIGNTIVKRLFSTFVSYLDEIQYDFGIYYFEKGGWYYDYYDVWRDEDNDEDNDEYEYEEDDDDSCHEMVYESSKEFFQYRCHYNRELLAANIKAKHKASVHKKYLGRFDDRDLGISALEYGCIVVLKRTADVELIDKKTRKKGKYKQYE